MGSAIVWLVNAIVDLIIFVIFVQAVLSWLVAFDVIKTRNRGFWQLMDMLDRITTPMLAPIRRIVPTLGGVDISPLVLLLALGALRVLFNRMIAPFLIGMFL